MGARTADAYTELVGPHVTAPFSANVADTYYQGSLVYIDAAGGVQLANVAADRFLGISLKQQVVAAGATVEVMIWGHIWLPLGTNIAAEDEGDPIVMDDATSSDNIADAQSATPEGDVNLDEDDCFIGRILRVKSPNMLVAIGHQVTGHIAAATATNVWT